MSGSLMDYIMDGRSSHNKEPRSGHIHAQKQLDALRAEHTPKKKPTKKARKKTRKKKTGNE